MSALLAEHEAADMEDLIEQVNDNPDEVKERFKIQDISGANWTFRMKAALEAKIAECKALADEEYKRFDKELKRIREWLESEIKVYNKPIALFDDLLLDYFHRERIKDKYFRLDTPYGKITTRKSDKWIYDDERLLESLKSTGYEDYIRVKEEPNKDAIRAAKDVFSVSEIGTLVSADGDVIDGVRVEKTESISVNTK